MRRYETIFILDPDLSDEGRVPVFERVKDLIPQKGGTLLAVDEWGLKKLAYEIKKKPRGYYVRVDYCGSGDVVDEMERFFRIDDRVMKYMTVLMDEDADLERLQAEMAEPEGAEPSTDEGAAADEEQKPDDGSDAADAPETEKPNNETTKEA